jgi:hypothetical protein
VRRDRQKEGRKTVKSDLEKKYKGEVLTQLLELKASKNVKRW